MSSLDLTISYRMARYVAGQESLADFRRWLLPVVWELGEPGQETSRLANRVELRLAEFMNGHWTEEDLRRMFQQLVPETSGLVAHLHATCSGFTASAPSSPVRLPGEYVPA